jgi:hypothetical protein
MKYISVVCLLLLTTACSQSKQAQNKAVADTSSSKKATGIQYTCTMHPDVIETKPGTCPKCGMQLVEKESNK